MNKNYHFNQLNNKNDTIVSLASAESLAKEYVENMRYYKMQLHLIRINRMIDKFADAYNIPHRKHHYWTPMIPALPRPSDKIVNIDMLSDDDDFDDWIESILFE